MATVESSSGSWNGQGLVHQTGPFRSTQMDRMSKSKSRDGIRSRIVVPYQINATGTLPAPSAYASAGLTSVVTQSIPMKKRAPMGNVKRTLTLASRAPMQTGHKMGNAPSEIVGSSYMPSPELDFFTPTSSTDSLMSIDTEIKPEPIGNFVVADSEEPEISMLGKRRGSDLETVGKKGKGVGKPGPSVLGKRQGDDLGTGGKKGKGVGKPGPSVLGKRQGDDLGTVGKKGKGVGKPGPSILGKRRGSDSLPKSKEKHARNLFQGPLKPEPINVAAKRKTEELQEGSIKKVKLRGRALKPGKIDTTIGQRFGQGRAENKSKPKKYDELPSPKTRARKEKAAR